MRDRFKLMRDLTPGDLVLLATPAGRRARITWSGPRKCRRIRSDGVAMLDLEEWWLVDITLADGPDRGRDEFVWGLPGDKVVLG